ncbi:Calcineurin-like phosphoesterase [Chitinophaga costaii]|uniref:Calcineurin-like phosphoesterase n=1 Tax=Chitinophaga costaii TaxID=1335309 RepID=A0A1C4FLT5_9BACT|nr:metallophosphoesterase [Chitinophaga costaii]PUZ29952.1 hypothetical protein DCM91_00255 [Chitinophaga costaii]SCC56958.1 Calcineurin-like phosphoesterase [Chitinophaga costaii]
MKRLSGLCLLLCWVTITCAQSSGVTHIVFTSDVHFGILRKSFRGNKKVQSDAVNKAMVAQINTLPGLALPADKGVGAGQAIQQIGYLAITGDICNRQQPPSPSASVSWKQFVNVYLHQLSLHAQLLLVPGNHDVSNAIGYYKPMIPATDNASLVGIYNLMLKPAVPKTAASFNFKKDKIHYARNIGGVHCLFLDVWPDGEERAWMEKDLLSIAANVPVLIFTHDPPEGDPAHFVNPFVPHTINKKTQYQNLLSDTLHAPPGDADEQTAFVKFLQAHRNIKAYFHGHQNWNQFYTYTGPAKNVSLPVFRVDSPMKGKESAEDEQQLSFQLISMDPANKRLTVRQLFWNVKPKKDGGRMQWGDSKTISLQ